jgi:hypothetical protein
MLTPEPAVTGATSDLRSSSSFVVHWHCGRLLSLVPSQRLPQWLTDLLAATSDSSDAASESDATASGSDLEALAATGQPEWSPALKLPGQELTELLIEVAARLPLDHPLATPGAESTRARAKRWVEACERTQCATLMHRLEHGLQPPECYQYCGLLVTPSSLVDTLKRPLLAAVAGAGAGAGAGVAAPLCPAIQLFEEYHRQELESKLTITSRQRVYHVCDFRIPQVANFKLNLLSFHYELAAHSLPSG